MREILLVARREVTERLRSRVFLITNGAFLLLVVIGVAFGGVIGGDSSSRLAAVEGQPARIAEVAAGAGDFEVSVVADRAAAEAAVNDGEVDAALVSGNELVVERDAPGDLPRILATAAQRIAIDQALADADVAPADRQSLLALPPVQVTPLVADGGVEFGPALAVGAAAVAFLYIQLILYGQWVAQGVVEEKASRIVEVLVATIPPTRLLAGKILGLGGLGFATVALVAIIGAVGLSITDVFAVPSEAYSTLAAAVGWYVLGFTVYATIFATAGALVSRVEDLSSASMPGIILLVGSFFLAQFSIGDPFSTPATIGALLPFSAPMLQPLLASMGALEPWMVVAGLASTLITIVALVPLAARIYTGGALRTGGRRRRDGQGGL